ncbi:Mur ligase [Radiomyces spectabilis]|uniref:Mur ligase n=1 Tax=Radiomyces spectabilis TaxID=64574 RepID=UPI002220A603|nr:Mur ligase [Radiomyces spectabilis]KAI8393422.1 Mur ligase [Radiomyces spectabilis]
MEFGLERTQRLLQALGNPHHAFKVIHVAGTNGKGSVCAYIASVLLQAQLKVGRFNSPHLLEPRDSINVNGAPLAQAMYDHACTVVRDTDKTHRIKASSFELLVVTAFWVFREMQLDYVILEVGLGGLLDATNVVEHPLCSIITPIGLDHVDILGGSLQTIAQAKAGIMKPGCPVIIAPQDNPEALETLIGQAQTVNAPYIVVSPAQFVSDDRCRLDYTFDDTRVHYEYPVVLHGDYQRVNSATAVTALDWLSRRNVIPPLAPILEKGMAATRWRGRMDWLTVIDYPKLSVISGLYSMLVDGAHNLPAAQALRRHVDALCQKYKLSRTLWVIGATEGKDIDSILKQLIHTHDAVISVPFSQPAGMPWIHCVAPEKIAERAQNWTSETYATDSLSAALQQTSFIYHKDNDLVVLCGSLYLVADLYRLIEQ